MLCLYMVVLEIHTGDTNTISIEINSGLQSVGTEKLMDTNPYMNLGWYGDEKNPKLNYTFLIGNDIDPLQWCLDNNINNIAIMGDSQGERWQEALSGYFINEHRKFNNESIRFRTVNFESKPENPDKMFFNDPMILTHQRECSSCASKTRKLTKYNIELEYLSNEFIIDTEIQRLDTHWDKTGDNRFETFDVSYSTQQYYLKYWFKKHGYPNVLLIFASTMHDKDRFTDKEYDIFSKHFIELLNHYIPDTTSIFWINSIAFNPQQKREKTLNLENIMIRNIQKYGNKNIHIHPINMYHISTKFDIYMGKNRRHRMDWAHFTQNWYNNAMYYIWDYIQSHTN